MNAVERASDQLRRPKTLIFCTSYAQRAETWNVRYGRWLGAIRRSALVWDQILLVDDGSNVLPGWDDLEIIREGGPIASSKSLALYHFADNLGRHSTFDFPGWYRSFTFGAIYAVANGFDKIVHLESDAFLISPQVVAYVNTMTEGWVALWCKIHQLPESAIQVIAGAAIPTFRALSQKPHSDFVGHHFEKHLPFTYVEKAFVGDRYSEYFDRVPRSADYVAQAHENFSDDYFWWLSDNPPAADQKVRRDEEYLCLCYDAKHMAEHKTDPRYVIDTYLRAAEIHTDRVEALYAASMHCFATGQNERGYQIAKRGLGVPPPAEAQGVKRWIYEFGLLDAYALNAYWAGHHQESLDAWLQALASTTPSQADRKRFLTNARHSVRELLAKTSQTSTA